MNNRNRYHIMWVGNSTERLLKGIKIINPDRIIFLVESNSEDWVEYQQESINIIMNFLGKTYQDRVQTYEFPFLESERDFLKIMFLDLYNLVNKIKNESKESSITIDITAAPKLVNYFITFIAMVLSNRDSKIRIVYTPKTMELKPSFYAALGSNFCDNEDMKLSYYRKMEANDVGGDTIFLQLPIIDFQLFNVKNPRAYFLISLFRKIPGVDSQKKHNGIIFNEIMESEEEIVKKYEDFNKNKKSLNNRISLGLQDFDKWGIIELEKNGQKYYAKKTWAGELISPIVEELYNNFKYFSE